MLIVPARLEQTLTVQVYPRSEAFLREALNYTESPYILAKKAARLAQLRANLTVFAVVSAIENLHDLDWQVVATDPSTGPFRLHPGHDLEQWMPDKVPRRYRDVARQLVASALHRVVGRLTPLSIKSAPERSPWDGSSPEEKEDRMLRLRIRMVGRLSRAVRDDGVPGLIALAEDRTVEEVLDSSVQSRPPLSHDQIDALLAELGTEEFVESDPFAKGMAGREVPCAKALTQAAAAVRELSWQVRPTAKDNWAVLGGRVFNSLLQAKKDDERSVARALIARTVRYLVPRSAGVINDARRGLDCFEADRAVHQLICDRIADAVSRDGYPGLGRLMVQ